MNEMKISDMEICNKERLPENRIPKQLHQHIPKGKEFQGCPTKNGRKICNSCG
jgi:hypothetical protein